MLSSVAGSANGWLIVSALLNVALLAAFSSRVGVTLLPDLHFGGSGGATPTSSRGGGGASATTFYSMLAAAPTTGEHWPVGEGFNRTARAVNDAGLVPCKDACRVPDTRCVREATTEGGVGRIAAAKLDAALASPRCFNVARDLALYTGLAPAELRARLLREAQFHFVGEHGWWAPASRRELAFYYRFSVSYLFANAIHCSDVSDFALTPADGPVLEYSGGVGNNVLALASKGIAVSYFGIGEAEAAFARLRVANAGLEHLVEFHRPFVRDAGLKGQPLRFESIYAVPDRQFGVVLAMDVLEHIPDYHVTLAHLVAVLRPGGVLLENTPFGGGSGETAIHVRASRPLAQEMARLGMHAVKPRRGTSPHAKIWVKGNFTWSR